MANNPTRELVNQYIWKRYIDNTSNYPEVDESEALEVFERHYAKHPIDEDDECYFFGVLCFEMAFQTEDEERQARLIKKAYDVLEIYRKKSGEEDWDAIEDRLEECRDWLKDHQVKAEAPAEVPAKPKIVDGMILVEAGKFLFGPQKEEKFLEGFYIDVNPVTNAEYRKFVEEENYRTPRVWEETPELAADELPVTGVSWMDALQYCKWAMKELPTEEQWEKAARGLDGRLYPWGDEAPSAETCNFHDGNGAARLRSLDGMDANTSPFGCRFTVGHVWEWTSTTFQGEGRYRMVKGGSWADPARAEFLSTYARLWAGVKEKSELIGFRCARPVKVL